jgi:mono/diheme cytochrome c family protein|tara:strand:- start:6008 stop:6661 length:654 start_codon:yes stop_codon:yes gene_type:complete
MRIFLILYAFVIVATVSILGFRGSLTRKTPIEVFPDMDRQAKYKPQASNSFFDDARNDRPIPLNTVARGNYHNQEEVFSADYIAEGISSTVYRTGKNLDGSFIETMPISASNELMQLGRKKYDIFCTSCHGAAGDGNGVTKPYGVLAASYHDDRLRGETDGYLYEVISNGKGLMYGLKDRITPEERWAIVLYMRALQFSQYAPADRMPEQQRKEIGL